VGVLAAYAYNAAGRRSTLTRGNGGVTGYGYDGALRLVSLGHTAPTGGSANNGFTTLAYNPASQIISQTLSNASYQWTGASPGTTGYAVNGLNQYTQVGGQAMAHDARGNMTNDGTKSYTYDLLNRLVSSNNVTTLTWDSFSRLYQVVQDGSSTRFLYDGARLIAEYSGAGAAPAGRGSCVSRTSARPRRRPRSPPRSRRRPASRPSAAGRAAEEGGMEPRRSPAPRSVGRSSRAGGAGA
jgi:hypothetical protein